jgi:single-stranded DNA-specific DHH superfamily exonuclease
MLTEKQLKEIREHLKKAQNPLFFFDNDVDGLTSFLLFRRHIDRGKGVAIKSFPELNTSYSRKLYELKPDYIFILDKPKVADGFLKEAELLNLPIVWIDHHDVPRTKNDNINYYNPFFNDGTDEPVSYLCYNTTNNKKDIWLAMIGCIGDGFFPGFVSEFRNQYPELWKPNIKTASGALYKTEIGKIARILNFALKDRTSKVVRMMKFLCQIRSPHDILDESKARPILQRFNQVNRKYSKLIEKAKKIATGKVLFFQYGGELSLSADIANELFFMYPEKLIVVAYMKGAKANVSFRWKNNVKELTLKAIEGLEGATGGGHEHATGAKVSIEDLPKLKERVEKLVEK